MVFVLVFATGCSNHLMNVALRTPVSVRLDTPVQMTTEVKTQSPPDNRASSIRARTIRSDHSGAYSGNRIAIVDIDGVLLNRNMTGLGSMGENPVALFREKLDAVSKSSNTCAVVVRINSPGGGVTACDIMRQELIRFREQSSIPVVACLMDTGAGGAYYIATACDMIVAHPTSIVGGVGVILNLYDVEETMAQFNIIPKSVRAGDRIDSGSPVRALKDNERIMLQAIADKFHQRFRSAVVASREAYQGDPSDDFDGSVFTADVAFEKSLIDQIGYFDDAVSAAGQLAGCTTPPSLQLYRRENDRALTPYDITPNAPLQNSVFPLSIPGLDRNRMPTFLYLWQIEPTLEKTGG